MRTRLELATPGVTGRYSKPTELPHQFVSELPSLSFGIAKVQLNFDSANISKENIEDALSEYENEDQYDRIEQFIRKKYDISKMNDIKYRQKVYAGSLRAGFNGSDVGEVIRNFESEN